MENLWKKEVNAPVALYIDLFESVQAEDKLAENEWENASSYQSFKDNQHSTELRMKGNMKLRLGLYTQALEFYTKSLSFAEIGSVNVGLAFACRSACFFEMQMYEKTLIDIEYAENSKLMDRLMSQLEERKRLCLEFLSMIDQCGISKSKFLSEYPSKYPDLSAKNLENQLKRNGHSDFSVDLNFPCMSDVVEIKQNQQFGRQLIAKCDIPCGQTVVIEKDFVSVKSDSGLSCATCFQENVNFIACSKCPNVIYCSQNCLNQNLTHKWECGTFFSQLHHKFRFQMQSILMALEIFPNVDKLMDFIQVVLHEDCVKIPASLHNLKSKYHFFLKLEQSSVICTKYLPKIYKIYEYLMLLPKVRALFDSQEKNRFLMHLVVHHFLVLKNNSIASGKPWSVVSVFNVLSMMNHSCAPNVYHPRIGTGQHCVTIRPVKQGEQLFISYLVFGNELGKEQRQEKLRNSWGFTCKCELCEPNNLKCAMNSQDCSFISLDPCYGFVIENYNNKNDTDKEEVLLENCIRFLNKYGNSKWCMEILNMIAVFVNLYIEKHVKLDRMAKNTERKYYLITK